VNAPERNIARATFAGLAMVTTIYVLVNAAVLYVLPIGVLARSTLPVGDAARLVLGQASSVVVTGLAIVAVATLTNLQIMEHARNTYALARGGMLPPRLTHVSLSGSPRVSLMVVLAAILIIIAAADLVKGTLYVVLLNLYAPMPMIIFLALAIASIVLRRAEPDLPRPWRMPLFPLPAILSATVNVILLVLFLAGDWKTGLCSALLLAAAFPLYAYGHNRWRGREPAT